MRQWAIYKELGREPWFHYVIYFSQTCKNPAEFKRCGDKILKYNKYETGDDEDENITNYEFKEEYYDKV